MSAAPAPKRSPAELPAQRWMRKLRPLVTNWALVRFEMVRAEMKARAAAKAKPKPKPKPILKRGVRS